MTTENRDSTRGVLWSAILGAVGFLVTLGGVLYAVCWLPFQPPYKAMPRVVEILPLEQEPASAKETAEPAYSWVDREAGIVRIPVEEAMDIVVETRPANEEATGAESEQKQRVIPTDAGSGRFVTPKAQPGEPRA